MEFIEISAKNVDDAITQATVQLGITSDQLEYEVLDKGSTGFLGIGSKNAVIKARKKFSTPQPSPFQPPCLEIQTTARANSPASTRMVMIPRSVSIEKTSLFALECAISVYTILRKRATASQWEKIAKKSKLGLANPLRLWYNSLVPIRRISSAG